MSAVCLSTLVVLIGVCALLFWQPCMKAGDLQLDYRPVDLIHPQRLHPERPLAVFLGDSTFLPGYAYPRQLEHTLGDAAEVRLYWRGGFEPFHHYLLSGRVMELSPELVVIVAQVRVFWRHEPLWYPDLLTFLPPGELPRAVLLPFDARSVSVPRLVLASLWGALGDTGESALRAFVGARERAEAVPGLRWLVPYNAVPKDPRRLVRLREERFLRYDQPIYPGHPAVQALAASVERCVRGGARTLVLLSPIPVAKLREAGLYHPEVFARRVGVIRDAVEAQGGELLDLHDLLGPDDFTDDFGHMSASGETRIARVITPLARQTLGLDAKPGGGRKRDPSS